MSGASSGPGAYLVYYLGHVWGTYEAYVGLVWASSGACLGIILGIWSTMDNNASVMPFLTCSCHSWNGICSFASGNQILWEFSSNFLEYFSEFCCSLFYH